MLQSLYENKISQDSKYQVSTVRVISESINVPNYEYYSQELFAKASAFIKEHFQIIQVKMQSEVSQKIMEREKNYLPFVVCGFLCVTLKHFAKNKHFFHSARKYCECSHNCGVNLSFQIWETQVTHPFQQWPIIYGNCWSLQNRPDFFFLFSFFSHYFLKGDC